MLLTWCRVQPGRYVLLVISECAGDAATSSIRFELWGLLQYWASLIVAPAMAAGLTDRLWEMNDEGG
jgi:hypothetical protein